MASGFGMLFYCGTNIGVHFYSEFDRGIHVKCCSRNDATDTTSCQSKLGLVSKNLGISIEKSDIMNFFRES